MIHPEPNCSDNDDYPPYDLNKFDSKDIFGEPLLHEDLDGYNSNAGINSDA